MITNIPVFLSLLWTQVILLKTISVPFLLFGFYYGFISTLPLGPSQLLATQAFLLQGRLAGTVAVVGSLTAQSFIFLSIYCTPFYIIWVKPHCLALLALPYMLFYWQRIKELQDFEALKPIFSFKEPKVLVLFLDSFFFQLLNPVLLPSPVFTRLLSSFLFRYSDSPLFILGGILGWLAGQVVFLKLSQFLLIRLEKDTPNVYTLVKRLIYRAFNPIVFILCLAYLGRVPVTYFTKRLISDKESWQEKPWPTFLFDYYRWDRPMRLIKNNVITQKSPVKRHVSQYLFEACVSDGRRRISYTYPKSLQLVHENLQNVLQLPNITRQNEDSIYEEWIELKKIRKDKLIQGISKRINILENGSFIKDIQEKRLASLQLGQIVGKQRDPRLGQDLRGRILNQRSPWIWLTNQTETISSTKKNRIKNWMSSKLRNNELKTIELPWDPIPLNKDARDTITKFSDGDIQDILRKAEMRADIGKDPNISLERILKSYHLSGETGKYYFEKTRWQKVKDLFEALKRTEVNELKETPKLLRGIKETNKQIQQINAMYKELPRWSKHIVRAWEGGIKLDEASDLRYGSVKSLGRLDTNNVVKRKSTKPDLRRGLLKGSIRARRRKRLIWKPFQGVTRSPFFLRIEENLSRSEGLFRLIPKSQTEKTVLKREQISAELSLKAKIMLKKREEANRLATAGRWDFVWGQRARGCLLVTQSFFRKYIKLPILITLKNLGRLLLFQKIEWKEDWDDWNREIYINCMYDGKELSIVERPPSWWTDGMQIKILNPFRLKPWHPSTSTALKDNNNIPESTYLTAWGFETNTPFGKIRKRPSFWKPVTKGINRSFQRKAFQFKRSIYKLKLKIYGILQKRWKWIEPQINIVKKLGFKFQKQFLELFDISFKGISKTSGSVHGLFFGLWDRFGFNTSTYNKKDITQEGFSKSYIQKNKTLNVPLKNLKRNDKENETSTDKSRLSTFQIKQDLISKPKEKDEFLNKKQKTRIQNFNKNKLGDFVTTDLTEIDSQKFSSNNKKNTKNELENKKYQYFTKEIKHAKKEKDLRMKDFLSAKDLQISPQYRLFQLKSKIVQLEAKLAQLKRNIIWLNNNIPIFVKKLINKTYRMFFLLIKDLYRSIVKKAVLINKHLTKVLKNLSYSYQINTTKKQIIKSFKNKKDTKKEIQTLSTKTNKKNKLSQAYILHKIWQNRMMNKPDLLLLMKEWTPELSLKEALRISLEKEGILGVNKTEGFREKNWKEWLRVFPRYTPSSKVWRRIAPQRWKESVHQDWIKNGYSFEQIQKQQKQSKNNQSIHESQRLNYHKFLFEQAEKLSKRWKSQMLLSSYTNLIDYTDKNQCIMWFNVNQEKSTSDRLARIKELSKEIKIDNEKISWGSKRVQSGRSSPMLVTSFTEKIESFPITKTHKRRKIWETSGNIFQRQRVFHRPFALSRWVAKNIKERVKNVSKASYLNVMMRDSNSYKDRKAPLPAKIERDAKLIYRVAKRSSSLEDMNEAVKLASKFMKKPFHGRRVRVLDDEVLTYNLVSSLLKLKKREKDRFYTKSQDNIDFEAVLNQNKVLSPDLFTPEELLLPKNIRELRVLEHLDLEAGLNDYKDLQYKENENQSLDLSKRERLENKEKNISFFEKSLNTESLSDMQQTQGRKRFLWPSYRLEDLACMNRFWLNAANGRRFSPLRIRMYPYIPTWQLKFQNNLFNN